MSKSPIDPDRDSDKDYFDAGKFEDDAYDSLGPWPFIFGLIVIVIILCAGTAIDVFYNRVIAGVL